MLYFGGRQPGGKEDSCPKAGSPPLTIGGKSFYRRRERAETAQAALTGILKLVMQWSDQWHLDCFKYSESLVPESVFSHFFEASSQNCGLYHGYSLVIM